MGLWNLHDAFEVVLCSAATTEYRDIARQRRVGLVVEGGTVPGGISLVRVRSASDLSVANLLAD
jgi:hypothetical protein